MTEAYDKVAHIVQRKSEQSNKPKTNEVNVKDFAALLNKEERETKRTSNK